MTIKFTAKNFGCLKDFEIDLQPLHALIGPNDSGKSTVLRGIEALPNLATQRGATEHFSAFVTQASRLRLATADAFYEIAVRGLAGTRRSGSTSAEFVLDARGRVSAWPGGLDAVPSGLEEPLVVKLIPEYLRQPAALLTEGQALSLQGYAGAPLAAIYDALNNRNPDAAQKIRDQLRTLFPTLDRLQLINLDKSKKALRLRLRDGTMVERETVSEGLLYFLAFAMLPYLDVRGPILIEEPENGLHPARIREVMNVLKEVSKTSQVVIATHSPLVINELEPEQVSIITRDPNKGSKATPMTKTKNFRERAGVYALGELWLSYADGDTEKELVEDGA